MKPRNTLLLALVVAAVGAFVWFYEIEGGAERAKQEEASKHLFAGVTAESIQSIELRTEDGATARLERAGDGLEAGRAARGAGRSLRGRRRGLDARGAGAGGDLRHPPEPLASYGLEGEPVVRFRAGDQDYALRLGNTAPLGRPAAW